MTRTAATGKRRTRKKAVVPGSYDAMFETVRGLAESINALSQQAVQAYTPVIEDIIRSRSHDIRHIERTLDGLLDFCGYDPALQLYRRLCRHYYDIDPVATVGYVNAYREMWDSESKVGAEA